MSEGPTTSAETRTTTVVPTMRRQATDAGAAVGGGGGDVGGSAAAEMQAFLNSLLEQQASLVGAIAGIVFFSASQARQGGVAATFVRQPDPAAGPARGAGIERTMLARMERIATTTAAESRGVVEAVTLAAEGGLYNAEPTHRLIGCPLIAAEQVHGATVLLAPLGASGGVGRLPPAEAIERLRLAAARFESFLWQQQALGEAHAKTRLRETLELLDAAQQGGDAESMASLFCHELARRFGCTRVSVGLVAGSRLKLAAVSGSDDLDRRGAAALLIEAAMEECADQDAEILFPQPPELEADPATRRVTRAHAELSAKFGPASILSLPLRVEGDLVGVVVLEREASDPFPPAAIPLMRLIAEFIGPAVWTRRLADRGVLAVLRDRTLQIGSIAVGPRYTGVKLLLALLTALVLAAALVPIPGRVVASAETRPAVSRLISPPFAGYLARVAVKPGDEVAAGQVLAEMELEEIRKQLALAQAEADKVRLQQADARAKGLRSEVEILEATLAGYIRQIDLLLDREHKAIVRAPIAGRISRGDVELLTGSYVEPSQPLFEVVAQEQPVVVVDVDERDIGRVRIGQEGWVSFAGVPGERVPLRIMRIRPVGEPVEGGNVYKAEAQLGAGGEPPAWVQPGMTGTVRLQDERTTVLAWLMRPLVDRARLYLWW